MTTTLDLSCKVNTNWYITLLCSSKINKNISGNFSRTLPDPWKTFLILKIMSISDFDHTLDLSCKVHTNWYITLLCCSKFYKCGSGFPPGTNPDLYGIFLTQMTISISSFDHIIIFVLYIQIGISHFHVAQKLTKVDLVIFQGFL